MIKGEESNQLGHAGSQEGSRRLPGPPPPLTVGLQWLTLSLLNHSRLELSSVPQQQQNDGLSPRLTGIWVTVVSTILREPRPPCLFYHPFLIPFSLVVHSSLLSLSSSLSVKSLHLLLCFSANSLVSFFLYPFPLHLQLPHPAPLNLPLSLISHAHRPFSSCLCISIWSNCPIEPPLFLPALIFLTSSNNFLCPPPSPHYYTLSSIFCQGCALSIPWDGEDKAPILTIGCTSIYCTYICDCSIRI